MQDPFDQKKQAILHEIGATNGGIPDSSPKGSIDEICIPIINLINSNQDMVTTSTCSGRVSVFLEGVKDIGKEEVKIGSKGNQGHWIFVTHHPEELPGWYDNVDFKFHQHWETNSNTRHILYKFEPLILHVKCRNLAAANALYTTAMNCGFRESGIGSNNIVAIRISIKLDVPIGYLEGEDYVSYVSKEYLGMITQLSLDRFRENFKKLDVLHKAIEAMRPKHQEKVETKEERRQRKIAEGMARRDGVLKQKEEKRREKELKEREKESQLNTQQ
ncbi:TYW3-domain-containing protein [Suhomyces tanzawaensis NRRL Y-17324]|uniref:tRNA wybutosine-synthesizing protein 3 n=1 Tax=Suhomyces tanzawaensis NRRL Y-17324 TaxID=984487 RepID=A0A1E4SIW2_9ASCO|nr:TYW3-domain-containing protein [Suhomyces tanzawaensis NRRL Y-17324]ODV79430.1 TYW3-domain-containing protein [Suhomyces tanzawaensis NRRL Y-17324]